MEVRVLNIYKQDRAIKQFFQQLTDSLKRQQIF